MAAIFWKWRRISSSWAKSQRIPPTSRGLSRARSDAYCALPEVPAAVEAQASMPSNEEVACEIDRYGRSRLHWVSGVP